MSYTIEARWAGYVLRERTVESEAQVEEAIAAIKDDFLSGIEHSVQGSIMKITVLCIDVLYHGKLYSQIDFKS